MDDRGSGCTFDGALIVDNGPASVRVAGVEHGLHHLAGLLRMTALVMLGFLLVARLGPLCEAAAEAAPVGATMANCDGKGTGTPEKKGSITVGLFNAMHGCSR